jgi:GTP-binding protein
MNLPTVAIVGRPNVGKSSLFNRFIRRRLAVVAEESGVTRDRNYTVGDWNGVSFRLVDTGGIVPASDDMMEKLIYDQAEFAITEADLILMVVDTHVGVDPVDRQIARRLHQSGSRCLLVANKADNEMMQQQVYEFMKLGLGEPIPASATSGLGIGDLLDAVVDNLPEREESPAEDEAIRVALVGRPNVGKSSFINKLIGQDRLIVSPTAGTTRDAIDTPFEYAGQKYILVDTAGLRKRYKVAENIEFYTNIRASRAIDKADVAVVLIDAVDGLTAQDQHILEMVHKMRRAALLAVNKWDLVEKDTHTADRYTKEIKATLARYANLPVIYVSALIGKRITKVLDLVHEVHEENHKRITTSELNRFLKQVIEKQQPPARDGKYIKFLYLTQSEVAPPTFIFFVNHPKLVDKSYIGYLTNQLRSFYGFEGVPIRLKFRRK